MKIRLYLILLLLLIYTCDRQLLEPLRNNPFDSASGVTDQFNLQTQNLSDHILVSWDYTYERPVVESYILYRINGTGEEEMLYVGDTTAFEDTDVIWDATYSYYVRAIINAKETATPEAEDIPEVVRRIVVGKDPNDDYATIGDALAIVEDGNIIYVKDGTYEEHIDFDGKKIQVICSGEAGSCIIDGGGSGPVVTFSLPLTPGDENTTTVLDGFTITGGNSNLDGGGMVVYSDPLIQNCTFQGNTSSHFGGAIMIERSAKPILRGCQFTANQAAGDGGAIFCDQDSRPEIENCTFTGNISSSGNGGALYLYQTTPTITNCTFSNNNTNDGLGGAVYIDYSNGFTINKCTFSMNEALKGGAAYIQNSRLIEFRQCLFTENTSYQGGAIYINESNLQVMPITFQNCIFWAQTATLSGGAIYTDQSAINMHHCTVSGNKAEGFGNQSLGGGLYCTLGSDILVKNSIFHENSGGGSPEIYMYPTSTASITFSDIEGGWEPVQNGWVGEDNIDTDPLFNKTNENYFGLKDGSPCKNRGENDVDMGAYGGIYGDWE